MSDENYQITLVLSVADINIILASLQEQPYKLVAPVIATIKEQGDKQYNSIEK